MNYEIRKVKYVDKCETISFSLTENVIFDVYGVYIRRADSITKHLLLDWVEDFSSLLEAEAYINTAVINNNQKDNMKKYNVLCRPFQSSYLAVVEAKNIEEAIELANEEADLNCYFIATENDVEEVKKRKDNYVINGKT